MEQFVNYGLPVEQQFFQFENIPQWVWGLTAEYKKRGRKYVQDIVSSSNEYATFITKQWEKRRNGIFIFIYGRPMWIPGRHRFFMNYYKMNQETTFRFVDWEYWLFKELRVYRDTNTHGMIEFTQRQDGKSYRAGSDLLYNVTSNENHHAGIQSKTNEDVKALFQRVVVLPWNRLPFYFLPVSDSDAYPAKEINFRDVVSNNDEMPQITVGLNSWIGTRATVYSAFDGYPLKDYFLDEAGKCEEMLVSDAWRVAKRSIRERGVIKGKGHVTTTVEMTTKGGLKEFKKMWDASGIVDFKTGKSLLNKLGQTESGLLPYFKAAQETYVFDQYGHSIIGNPDKEQIEYIRRGMEQRGEHQKVALGLHMKGGRELVDIEIESINNPEKRAQQIRMMPRSIREAFRADPKNCNFNLIKIDNRLDDFRFGNDLIVTGNLYWKDNVQDCDEVIWRETTNGKWSIKKSVLEYILKISNNVGIRKGWKAPLNTALGAITCDPYKFDATNQERKSLGVAHVYMHYIPDIDAGKMEEHWETDDLVMEYGFRGSVDQFDEDMIMTCVFFGMEIAPEINAGDVWPQLSRRGYDKFLKFRNKLKKSPSGSGTVVTKSNTPGFTTLGDNMKVPLFQAVDQYIENKAHRCVFPNFLTDCREVEYQNLNPFDYFVSGGYGIYLATTGNIRQPKREESKRNCTMMWEPETV